MKLIVLLFGAFYGLFSVVFGAFGAHLLKQQLSTPKLDSFEVGVRYQMYHALLLLLIGFLLEFKTGWERGAAYFIIIGTGLFSFSIYALSLSEITKIPTKIIGPITPIGGLLMILGWLCLTLFIIKKFT